MKTRCFKTKILILKQTGEIEKTQNHNKQTNNLTNIRWNWTFGLYIKYKLQMLVPKNFNVGKKKVELLRIKRRESR